MSSTPAKFASPPPFRPAVLRVPIDAVPSVEELEHLQSELVILKQRTLERARKAAADLRTMQETVGRARERERAKARAPEKIKRERDGVYYHSPPSYHPSTSHRLGYVPKRRYVTLVCDLVIIPQYTLPLIAIIYFRFLYSR
jgi:hypothetical protein